MSNCDLKDSNAPGDCTAPVEVPPCSFPELTAAVRRAHTENRRFVIHDGREIDCAAAVSALQRFESVHAALGALPVPTAAERAAVLAPLGLDLPAADHDRAAITFAFIRATLDAGAAYAQVHVALNLDYDANAARFCSALPLPLTSPEARADFVAGVAVGLSACCNDDPAAIAVREFPALIG